MLFIIKNKLVNKSVHVILTTLMILAVFFSLQSNIFDIGILSPRIISIVIAIIFIMCLFRVLINKRYYVRLLNLLTNYQTMIYWFIFFGMVVYQYLLLSVLDAQPKFDAGVLLNFKVPTDNFAKYLSRNVNNEFLYFFNHTIYQYVGFKNEIPWFQGINIALISVASLLLKFVGDNLFENKSIGYAASLFFIYFSEFQPIFLVPYTDTYCLIPMFLSILWIIKAFHNKQRKIIVIYSILAGVSAGLCYLVRPSAIIFVIALFVYLIINLWQVRVRTFSMFFTPSFILGVLVTIISFNAYVATQTDINIEKGMSKPIVLFALIGSSGNQNDDYANHGAWDAPDIQLFNQNEDKKDIKHILTEALIARTKQRRLGGTIKFYVQKFRDNIDTGVIGYHRDGLWLNYKDAQPGSFKGRIQQVYYQDGKNRPTFNFICQIIWLIILGLVLYALQRLNDWRVTIIALALIGGLTFLEIFESGGTKYLFQYVPLISLLAAVGLRDVIGAEKFI